jgi:hypothetical protein
MKRKYTSDDTTDSSRPLVPLTVHSLRKLQTSLGAKSNSNPRSTTSKSSSATSDKDYESNSTFSSFDLCSIYVEESITLPAALARHGEDMMQPRPQVSPNATQLAEKARAAVSMPEAAGIQLLADLLPFNDTQDPLIYQCPKINLSQVNMPPLKQNPEQDTKLLERP